jgi:ABC-type phosphate transport system substrate-binding protein
MTNAWLAALFGLFGALDAQRAKKKAPSSRLGTTLIFIDGSTAVDGATNQPIA